jgi:hypothetical protein
LPFFVAHWGLDQFARRIPEFGLDSRVDLRLRAARIETLGALLMHSRRSLSHIAGIGPSAIKDIQKRLDIWRVRSRRTRRRGLILPPVGFSVAYVYRREVGEAIYEPSHRPNFYRA